MKPYKLHPPAGGKYYQTWFSLYRLFIQYKIVPWQKSVNASIPRSGWNISGFIRKPEIKKS